MAIDPGPVQCLPGIQVPMVRLPVLPKRICLQVIRKSAGHNEGCRPRCGGPSGAFFAAEKLARAGIETVVFDEKLAWEKPCGGGLTWKAYSQYPFLTEGATPKKVVRDSVLTVPGTRSATLRLDHPILIYSRYDLNAMLLERAPEDARRCRNLRGACTASSSGSRPIRMPAGTVSAL